MVVFLSNKLAFSSDFYESRVSDFVFLPGSGFQISLNPDLVFKFLWIRIRFQFRFLKRIKIKEKLNNKKLSINVSATSSYKRTYSLTLKCPHKAAKAGSWRSAGSSGRGRQVSATGQKERALMLFYLRRNSCF